MGTKKKLKHHLFIIAGNSFPVKSKFKAQPSQCKGNIEHPVSPVCCQSNSFPYAVTTSRILICIMSSDAKKNDFHRRPYHYPFPFRTRPAPLWFRPNEHRTVTKQKRIAKTTLTGQGRRSRAPYACDCEIVPVLEDIRNEHSP